MEIQEMEAGLHLFTIPLFSEKTCMFSPDKSTEVDRISV